MAAPIKPASEIGDKRARKNAVSRVWRSKNATRMRQYARDWRKNNPGKDNAYSKKYYDNLPLERKRVKWERARAWFLENPEYAKEYYSANKDQATAKAVKRKTLKLSRILESTDLNTILEMYKLRSKYSSEDGMQYDLDHIIPLDAGGYHHQDNLQILPSSINKSKGHNPFWEMDGYKSWRDVPEALWPKGLFQEYEKRKNEIND